MKNRFLVFMIFALASFPIFGQTVYTADENNLIQETVDKRINLRKEKTVDASIAKVNGYISAIKENPSYKNSQQEVQLVVDSLFVCAKYNCLYEKNRNDSNLENLIVKQLEIIDDYVSKNKKTEFNKWFYLAYSEVINSSMQFLSKMKAIQYGLKEKDYLDSVVKNNPNFSYGLISAGLWYYFAPGIGGGSKSKAKKYFLAAAQNASNNYEKYYANIYYSQTCFEDKKYDECTKYLSNASNVIYDTNHVSTIIKLNESGYSYFDYAVDKKKIEENSK